MKNLLILFVLISSLSFSQDVTYTAKLENSTKFQENKVKGSFNFIFPKEISKEQIEKNAKFYTNHFQVKFIEKTNLVEIEMVNNDERSRSIIKRFLISNQVKKIKIDDKELSIDQFYNEYLK